MVLWRHAPASALLSGSLLLATTCAPNVMQQVVEALSKAMPPLSLVSAKISLLRTALGGVFVVGALRWAHRVLSELARNSWDFRPTTNWDWPNEIAVITGGSSGIGKSLAETLLEKGIRVAVIDVQQLPKPLKDHPRVHFYKCDVSDGASVSAAAEAIRDEVGSPSILVNNAGIASHHNILACDEAYLRKIFGVNCFANWFTTREFLPSMIQANKGHVVTVASLASFFCFGGIADYAGSKAAARAFHEALGTELRHRYKAPNVLTTIVHPHYVRTPCIGKYIEGLERHGFHLLEPEDVADKIVAQLMSRRSGELILPESEIMLSSFRAWPTWIQEPIRDIFTKS
uniref:Short-chain dehydrogenase/reductase 3 n=1 Tax=Bionectria ochroleuca TaxID=29856 RepID=A0A8H7TTY5_BIOOC